MFMYIFIYQSPDFSAGEVMLEDELPVSEGRESSGGRGENNDENM